MLKNLSRCRSCIFQSRLLQRKIEETRILYNAKMTKASQMTQEINLTVYTTLY